MTINIIPVNPTVDTFSSWVERTNEVINAIAIHTITTGTDAAVGNVAVVGSVSSNTVYAEYLSGATFNTTGDPSPSQANLTISSNVTFAYGTVNLGNSSNVVILGSNATHRVLTVNTSSGSIVFDKVKLETDFDDVNISSPAVNDVLTYGGAGQWINSNNITLDQLNVNDIYINDNLYVAGINGNTINLTDQLKIQNNATFANVTITPSSINLLDTNSNTTIYPASLSMSFNDGAGSYDTTFSQSTLYLSSNGIYAPGMSGTANLTVTPGSMVAQIDTLGYRYSINSLGIIHTNINNGQSFKANGSYMTVGNNYNSVTLNYISNVPTITVGNTVQNSVVNSTTISVSNTNNNKQQFTANTSTIYFGNSVNYATTNTTALSLGNTVTYFRANTSGFITNNATGYVSFQPTLLSFGNTTVNTVANSSTFTMSDTNGTYVVNTTAVALGNSLFSASISAVGGIFVGNSSVNAFANSTTISVGIPGNTLGDGGFRANTSAIYVGNSTSNFVANSSGIYKNNIKYSTPAEQIMFAVAF